MIYKSRALVVGAGVIGSSVAMHLARLGMIDVRVIDFDLEGTLSSSELNAGGVRATWTQPINIQMSKATIDYLAEHAEEVGYRAAGYLWLHNESQFRGALEAQRVQESFGWPVEVWDPKTLQERYPFLDKLDGVVGACFAPRDGLVNPNLLKNHFRSEGRKLGVIYDDRTLLRSVEYSSNGAPIKIVAETFEQVMSHETKLEILTEEFNSGQSFRNFTVGYEADLIINCAGPWAAQVAKICGYHLPVGPVRRQVSVFSCGEVDLTHYGMVVDTSGVYFHPEATYMLAGFANRNEPRGINYSYDGESFFQETLWPALYERSSSFEKLKHITGWAGLYEVSPDECAVLGSVRAEPIPKDGMVYEAHSFSGHGVMHSYSAGLALAELIVKGRYETIDASALDGVRFQKDQFIRENLVI